MENKLEAELYIAVAKYDHRLFKLFCLTALFEQIFETIQMTRHIQSPGGRANPYSGWGGGGDPTLALGEFQLYP